MEIIYSAFILGLITGFHCLGMCGPIALSLGLNAENKIKFHVQNFTYQFGRIVTYSILGAILGIVGESFNLAGFQNPLSILVGVVLILIVVVPKITSIKKIKFLDVYLVKLKVLLGGFLQKKSTSSKFITGLLNGLLPCGAVYVALTASIATGGVANGFIFMFFFGLGTLPLMYLAVVFGNVISIRVREILYKLFPYFIILFGILFILRGMQLGIKFISPNEDSLQLYPKKECCQ